MQLVHEMRASRCERDVLDRLLSIAQVRTASIDTQLCTIKYLWLGGTTDRTESFPMGSKVGDIGLGLGWYCVEVVNMYGEVLDPKSNADEDDTVMVRENSGILELAEAQELVERMQRGLGIMDQPTKCHHLADIETRITERVRERMDFLSYSAAEYLPNRQIIDFKRNMLFNVRMAFLSCSAAPHFRSGGDESDLDQFSTLIHEFTPDSRSQAEWMAVTRNALVKSRIFPSMLTNSQRQRRWILTEL